MDLLKEASSERQFIMYEALRKGQPSKTFTIELTSNPVIEQMKGLVELEEEILKFKGQTYR